MPVRMILLASVLCLNGCGFFVVDGPDAGPGDGDGDGDGDGGVTDAGEPFDAAEPPDAAGGLDAGSQDAGDLIDAGTADSGPLDAGALDAGALDAGAFDAGGFDAGGFDAGGLDAGVADAGEDDAGADDAGNADAGAPDDADPLGPDDYVYFTERNEGVFRVPALGGTAEPVVKLEDAFVVSGISKVVGADVLLVCDPGLDGAMYTVNTDGSDLAVLYDEPCNRVVHDPADDALYWVSASTDNVSRGELSGTGATELLGMLNNPLGIDLDAAAGHLYISTYSTGDIVRVDTDGQNPITVLIQGTGPRRIEVDAFDQMLYWVNSAGAGTTVYRAGVTGNDLAPVHQEPQISFGIAHDPGAKSLFIPLFEGLNFIGEGSIVRVDEAGGPTATVVEGIDLPMDLVVVRDGPESVLGQ